MDKLPTHTTMRIHKITAKKLRKIYGETSEPQIDIVERLVEAEFQRMNEQEEERKAYDALTTGLSKHNDQLLTVGLPMTCDADSTDVEYFIINVYKQPVDDDNYIEVGHKFKDWYIFEAQRRKATNHDTPQV